MLSSLISVNYFPGSLLETGNQSLDKGFKQLAFLKLDTVKPAAAKEKSHWHSDNSSGNIGQ